MKFKNFVLGLSSLRELLYISFVHIHSSGPNTYSHTYVYSTHTNTHMRARTRKHTPNSPERKISQVRVVCLSKISTLFYAACDFEKTVSIITVAIEGVPLKLLPKLLWWICHVQWCVSNPNPGNLDHGVGWTILGQP